MAVEDLLAEFESYQKEVTESAQKSQSKPARSSFNSENQARMIRFGLSKGESVKVYKGFFVTMPGNDGYKFSRRINNIKQFGCDKDVYGISGFKVMPAGEYDNLDEESETLLRKYNSLWEELNKMDLTELKKDGKFYIMSQTIDAWYMYLTDGDGVDKPGYYLCTSKSRKFITQKAEWMQTTKEALESAGADPTNLLRDFVDNTVTKTNKISIEITRSQGYNYKFSSMKMKMPSDQVLFDQSELDNLEPLSKCFVDKTSVNKTSLKKACDTLALLVAKAQTLQAKSEATSSVESAFED